MLWQIYPTCHPACYYRHIHASIAEKAIYGCQKDKKVDYNSTTGNFQFCATETSVTSVLSLSKGFGCCYTILESLCYLSVICSWLNWVRCLHCVMSHVVMVAIHNRKLFSGSCEVSTNSSSPRIDQFDKFYKFGLPKWTTLKTVKDYACKTK